MGIKPMARMEFNVGPAMLMRSMGGFAEISSSTGRGTVILAEGEDTITGGGTLHPLATKLTRSNASIEANNEVRANLLKRLGETFGVLESSMYNKDKNGKPVYGDFSSDYLKNLKFRLGDALKFKDFGIDLEKGGKVSSGKPLTERRITAINEKLSTYRGTSATEAKPTGIRDLDLRTFEANHFIRNFLPETTSGAFLHNIVRACYLNPVDGDAVLTDDKKLSTALVKLHDSAKKEFAKCQSRAEMLNFMWSTIDKINAVFKGLKQGPVDGLGMIRANKDGKWEIEYDTEYNPDDEDLD